MADPPSEPPLRIFRRFLRFGLLAWGGPVAQIAMLKRALVEEERWVEPGRFARLLAVYQLLPGPEAHELCVHFGMIRGRRLGGLMAGLGFMAPGLILMLALAALYQRIDLSHPSVAALLAGVQVGAAALVVRAVHRIGEHALGSRALLAIAAGAAAATALGASFWIVLIVGGLAMAAAAAERWVLLALTMGAAAVLAWLTAAGPGGVAIPAAGVAPDALALFWSGLKAGLLTFGGAYAAIPFVREDMVGKGWVSEGQFLDGLALAALIPAPLIIFTTFVGWQAGGLGGALAITAGVFLPAFAFGLLFFERLEGLVENRRLHAFLEGVAAAVVGLLAVTAVELVAGLALRTPSLPFAALTGIAGLAILYAWRATLAIAVVVLGSGLLGLVLLGL